MDLEMRTYQKIYTLVKRIPKGKVATYAQIAQMLDLDPRVVGWALNRLAKHRQKTLSTQSSALSTKVVPWQRVINSNGGISTNKVMNIPLGLQKKLLQREGIRFNSSENVDLKKYLWTP